MNILKTALILVFASLLSACGATSSLSSGYHAVQTKLNSYTVLRDQYGCFLNGYGYVVGDHAQCEVTNNAIMNRQMTIEEFESRVLTHNEMLQRQNNVINCRKDALFSRNSSAHCGQSRGTAVNAHSGYQGQQPRYTDQELIGGSQQDSGRKGLFEGWFK